jgi:hypothetical protein
MWTTLWLGALAILLCKPFTPRRAILFGLLIGAAAGVSMKTTLLLGTLVPAIGIVFLIEALRGNKIAARDPVSNAIAMLLGMAVLPGLLLAFFAWKGALAELRYCVFKHNIVPGLLEVRPIPLQLRPFLFPLIALLSMAGALAILRGRGGWMKPRQAAVLLLASGFYIGALLSYWPVLADEDYLPFFPLLALVAAPLAVHRRNLIPFLRHGPDAGFVLPAAIAALLIAIILWSRPPMKNDTLKEVQLVADVLKLTAPGDYVLDTKGETIFRPRAWYFVMETMTDESVVRGEIYDNIPEELVALCVPVVVSAKMYDRSRAFILANYIRVAHKLKVLGKALPPGRANSRAIRFDVEIPARYVMADEQGLVAGDLDGTPSNGPRLLERGPHTFRPATDSATPMLFWANAWEKGYLPKLHGNK